ncbi:MAG: PLP-dependent transferase [Rubellimicrobium sp.]|nr:PLP-dependent transferase [Rubellimicrobium sp.]
MAAIHERLGLRRVINAAGTMTDLGASIIGPEARAAMDEAAGAFFEMDALFGRASATIAELTGAEAGFVTSSAASGITLSVAGAMTGDDLAAIERLPDASGLKSEVVLLAGHAINFGAPVTQMIRLAGARPVIAGQATSSAGWQVAGAITDRTAAALYVVSHHCAPTEQVDLAEFAEIAHARGVPVIVDAASEYDLRGFHDRGADLVIHSGHKFLAGPTSGMVSGRAGLVRAAWLQNRGIGRAMKVGKEGIAGLIAALEAWRTRDHAAMRRREGAALALWSGAVSGLPGVRARAVPDPTGNPLDRLELVLDPEAAGITAWDLARELMAGDPAVATRDMEAEHGILHLDPCNLHAGEAETVADLLRAILGRARAAPLRTDLHHERRIRARAPAFPGRAG